MSYAYLFKYIIIGDTGKEICGKFSFVFAKIDFWIFTFPHSQCEKPQFSKIFDNFLLMFGDSRMQKVEKFQKYSAEKQRLRFKMRNMLEVSMIEYDNVEWCR